MRTGCKKTQPRIRRCKGRTLLDQPCRLEAKKGSDYCRNHQKKEAKQ